MIKLIGLLISQGGFRVTGKLATQCSLQDPLSGELTVEASSVPITSIDVHLLRVESIIVGERVVTETSLIQSTQVLTMRVLVCSCNNCNINLLRDENNSSHLMFRLQMEMFAVA